MCVCVCIERLDLQDLTLALAEAEVDWQSYTAATSDARATRTCLPGRFAVMLVPLCLAQRAVKRKLCLFVANEPSRKKMAAVSAQTHAWLMHACTSDYPSEDLTNNDGWPSKMV